MERSMDLVNENCETLKKIKKQFNELAKTIDDKGTNAIEKIEAQKQKLSIATFAAPIIGTVIVAIICFIFGEFKGWPQWLDAGVAIGVISIGLTMIGLLVAVFGFLAAIFYDARSMNASTNSRIDNLADQIVNLSTIINGISTNLISNISTNLSGQISNLSSQINQLQSKNIILPK